VSATRTEHAAGIGGNTPRYAPIEPVIRLLLLTGMRFGEALTIEWGDVREHAIEIRADRTKTKMDRTIELDVCPSVPALLETLRGGERVLSQHTEGSLNAARKRMLADKACPWWDYQLLRVTAATYLACMQSYGPVLESRQLGHSIVVAEKHYIGRVRITLEAKTLEEAMGLG
jgi:integrase